MAKRDVPEFQLLDDVSRVSLAELVAASGLALEELVELIDYGVFEPVERRAPGASAKPGPERGEPSHAPGDHPALEWRVTSHSLYVARRAGRLQRDFGLDAGSIALALSLLERIDELERELHDLRCYLPR